MSSAKEEGPRVPSVGTRRSSAVSSRRSSVNLEEQQDPNGALEDNIEGNFTQRSIMQRACMIKEF